MYSIEPNHLISVARAVELQKKIENVVYACMDKAYAIWPSLNINYPSIQYDLKGQVAGQANSAYNSIRVNAILAHENEEDYLSNTLPHEVSHLITRALYGQWYCGRKVSSHGVEWKGVMRALGCEPSRCHSYDVSNVKVKTKRQYKGYCIDCGKTYDLTKRHIENMWRICCRVCKGKIALNSEFKVERKIEIAAQTTTVVKDVLNMKQLAALEVMRGGGKSNVVIPLIAFKCGISEGYARTLYYSLKKYL